MKLWKAVAAALAMLAGISPAWAVRFVEYRVEASGTFTDGVGGQTYYGPVAGTLVALLTIDVDVTPIGTNNGITYYATGSTYTNDQASVGRFEQVAFTPTTITGGYRSLPFRSRTEELSIAADGSVTARKTQPIGVPIYTSAIQNFSGTVTSVTTRDVSGAALFSFTLPEPGTWALMLVGFGIVGGSIRGRGFRRVTA